VRVSFGRNSETLEIVDANDYYPFGMNHLKSGTSFFGTSSYKNYKYDGKELQESGMYDYGARMYMSDIGRWGVHDPLSDATFQPYNYANNNPIYFNDPTGMVGEAFASVGVIKNEKGDYEIISAKNDGDYGIYMADAKGNYDIKKSKRVGTLNNSFDFLLTNDETGGFIKDKVAKKKNGSNLTLNTSLDLFALLKKYDYNTDNGNENYFDDLAGLAYNSANYDGTKGKLDLKSSLGLDVYAPVMVGKKYTSLRAASNILFGFNMRKIYDKHKNNPNFKAQFNSALDFYNYAMRFVGAYNQFQNNRQNFYNHKMYNSGFPFYGEHTYSGTNIHRGYFHKFGN
jgi:RHS repeat-associated protein